MGRLVTFYSYKGGVGRSMALANVALLLAQRGLKVLAVDFDLEAPGLERYFGDFEQRETGPGLLRMVADVAGGHEPVDYRRYVGLVATPTAHPITLLASGREQDSSYSKTLEHFDWEELFARHGGGDFFEALRTRWRQDFDIVLIDSRTGLSDTGGICTIQLPDVVVAMFTANFQSLYGVRDVMRLAQRARQGLAYDRMPLTVLPLPARWGMQEFQETQVWLDRVVDGVCEFFDDWLPRPLTARGVIERLRLPQQDFFGFGERLAVVEQGVADPASLGFIYDRVASILAQDFSDIASVLGITPTHSPPISSGLGVLAPAAMPPAPARADIGSLTARQRPARRAEYDYDVYVSFDSASADFVLPLVKDLQLFLDYRAGRSTKFFVDVQELQTRELWASRVAEALAKSRTMLCVITPRWAASIWAQRELQAFTTFHGPPGLAPVVPVLLRKTELPEPLKNVVCLDMTDLPLRGSMGRNPKAVEQIARLADALTILIEASGQVAPTYPFVFPLVFPLTSPP